MLDDSHKKLRGPARAPRPVNLRPAPKRVVSAADRLANARDKTSIYAFTQQSDMTEEERQKYRKEMKERFTPGARPMPTSLQGLTSLANERIEDAIARGQFKNIQRGKGINIERDYTANSPFLDTTEYFMNKIIQKQEIVPPWIEKQQELVSSVNRFRGRLRNDWKRHAARVISSKGGAVQDQVRTAKAYALAEEQANPRLQKREALSSISSSGELVTVTVEERMAAGIHAESEKEEAPQVDIKVTESTPEDAPPVQAEPSVSSTTTNISPTPSVPLVSPERILPMSTPFRDPAWEGAELSYHTLAVKELNNLTRSYNLMAPKIAQKPYYNLQRELNRCFADVAPLVADEILERSRKPVVKVSVAGHREGGVMERFGAGTYKGHVRDVEELSKKEEAKEKGYGFKQFWKDLFRKDEPRRGVL